MSEVTLQRVSFVLKFIEQFRWRFIKKCVSAPSPGRPIDMASGKLELFTAQNILLLN